ncbi:hypothetical protein GGX14DRAFT_396926 [Mycena pura]|uniref:Uncharacterized protein n=1 Tax=Mycena pura TaxID=153505 RepID=A0AAD6V964_9AGAR|nr:hypothetical protein GGX14DRAFT_396926 [Mycena pura]
MANVGHTSVKRHECTATALARSTSPAAEAPVPRAGRKNLYCDNTVALREPSQPCIDETIRSTYYMLRDRSQSEIYQAHHIFTTKYDEFTYFEEVVDVTVLEGWKREGAVDKCLDFELKRSAETPLGTLWMPNTYFLSPLSITGGHQKTNLLKIVHVLRHTSVSYKRINERAGRHLELDEAHLGHNWLGHRQTQGSDSVIQNVLLDELLWGF